MSTVSNPQLPRLDVVIGNNFGHLPMFIGAEKGIFEKHGVDARMKVVDTGTDMVNTMRRREAQIGDMSVTTFLKAVHSGEPFRVIGIIMNDATRDNADEPLAIVTRKGTGINAGKVSDLKGRRIGLAIGQTSDEYFKMVLRRAKMKYEDLTIENIWSQFGLAPALKEGKVDAVVTWEPYVTAVLEQVPGSFLVIRGGGHMSYVMVATAHAPTIASSPAVVRNFVAGLAGASHYTRNNRDEAVEIFAKWVPNTDIAVGKKAIRHISYDPRLSPAVIRAFEAAEDEVLINTLPGAPRLIVPDQFSPVFLTEVEKTHPEYFKDLPALK
ncbi:MAG: ABC transporter substrate-binding protein [Betaproteobacteria bacterium]|nr:ABC transporter substrate-binding protein [Betaproteobacteria bacterium]